MEDEWQPADQDIWRGSEAYVRYVGGIILLHDPDCDVSQGLIGPGWHEGSISDEEIIVQAEEVMYNSLRTMIALANPARFRSPISRAEHRHGQAIPHINGMVAETCRAKAERLGAINPAVTVIRPMPLADPSVYAYICHGRRQKIVTRRLLDPFMPAPGFMDLLEGRVLPPSRQPRFSLHGETGSGAGSDGA